MKFVFGLFDKAQRAEEAERSVAGYAKVSRITDVGDLDRYGLRHTDVQAFSDGLRRGSTLLLAETNEANVTTVEREFARPSTISSSWQAKPGERRDGPSRLEAAKETAQERIQAAKARIEQRVENRRAGAGVEPTEQRAKGLEQSVETAIPIVEEKINVGKHTVDRGGVRIVTHVVERPFDTTIDLREEQIEVERRTVRRGATREELVDRSISVRAVGEEPEITKTAEVVEEVIARKTTSTRKQPVHDVLKRTEVEVRREDARISRPSHP
ncbi:MAG: YsnF/AvaK domain-containing protein [Polyangiales bacterium]